MLRSEHSFHPLQHGQARDRIIEEKYRRIIQLIETKQGNEDPRIADALNSPAAVMCNQKRYADAEACLLRALMIEEKTSKEETLQLSQTALGLASVYHELKQYAEAEPYYQRAIAIRRRYLDDRHPDLYDAVWAYENLLRAMGRTKEADAVADSLPPYSIQTDLRRQYGDEEAERMMREMLEKRRKR
ncbi:MAG: tetratricopeptide repeat protein [Acidobacteriota bacterium]